jgi:hypothetical protein
VEHHPARALSAPTSTTPGLAPVPLGLGLSWVIPKTSSGRWVLHVLQVPSMNHGACLQQALLSFCAFCLPFLLFACGRLGHLLYPPFDRAQLARCSTLLGTQIAGYIYVPNRASPLGGVHLQLSPLRERAESERSRAR